MRLLCTVLALGLVVGAGCNRPAATDVKKGKEEPKAQKEEGWLYADAGEKFHIRLTIDAKEKKATAKLFDESARDPIAIDQESITMNLQGEKAEQIKLTAQGEKGKKASVFAATHDRFGEKIDPKKVEFAATIDGKGYTLEYDDHH